jgi:hypothetical protein
MRTILILVSLFSVAVQAFPIGDVHFMAKVVGFDQNTVKIEAAGKNYTIARTAIKGDLSSGQVREVSLSQSDYSRMRLLR